MGKLIDIRERLLDAADLVIDFATLGEYGLEPASEPASACESRRRPHPSRAGSRRAATGDLLARP